MSLSELSKKNESARQKTQKLWQKWVFKMAKKMAIKITNKKIEEKKSVIYSIFTFSNVVTNNNLPN